MSDPLENKEFTHFLNFKNDDTGLMQISEPVKFDSSEFMIVQVSDGYARDVTYMNEEVNLEFYKGFFEKTDTPYALPSGIVVDMLGHAFELLMQYYNDYGFESEIEYILERNGVQFILGVLNFEITETDELTYLNCKVVQSTKRALIKRRENIKVNCFSEEDLDGNPITPLVAENILLKAKPFFQSSDWYALNEFPEQILQADNITGRTQYYYYNNCSNVNTFGIEDTLSFFDILSVDRENENLGLASKFEYILAKNNLTDIKVRIKDLTFTQTVDGRGDGDGYAENYFRIAIGETINDLDYVYDVDTSFITDSIGSYTFSVEDETFEFPAIESGKKLWIYFRTKVRQSSDFPLGNPGLDAITTVSKYTVDISGTATAVDSVIKGVRYIDLLKYAVKSTSGLDVSAPKWELNGEFYDQFAFSGNLIRRRDDKPFYITYKDRRENLMEVNGDCQINSNDVFAGQYNDFYTNVDNGGFLLIPSEDFKTTFNERYAINSLNFKYKNYEKDKDEKDTIDAVHTEGQWHIPNKLVQNVKSIDISDIRDAFSIEFQRKKAIENSTALDTDNKIFVLDIVELAPGTLGGFTKNLLNNVTDDGDLKLLSDNSFSWDLLGFNVGDTFKIVSGDNQGDYDVIEIEPNTITLRIIPPSSVPTESGQILTEVTYPYTNVQYVNRTNENFDIIENISSPRNFSNLKYTIRRNLVHWESYMNTASKYISADIKNSFFESNGEAITQYDSGTIYQENEAIPLDSLQDKILSPKVYELPIIVEYEEALDLIGKYEQEATLGGFIRVQDNKGAVVKVYPQKFGYVWQTKVLTITGEQRNESDFVTISNKLGVIEINEVGYDNEILPEIFWDITGDYVIIKDNNSVNIINLTKFDKIQVNGEVFPTTVELAEALIRL